MVTIASLVILLNEYGGKVMEAVANEEHMTLSEQFRAWRW